MSLLQATKDADGNAITDQLLALGPVASQLAIKQLGTNGGGFFNVNSAHPFENPTALSNFFQIYGLLLIPFALTYTFGRMVKDTRQGWTILGAMAVVFLPMLWLCVSQEQAGNPAFASLHIDQIASALQSGGNMEGKEAALRHLRLGHLPPPSRRRARRAARSTASTTRSCPSLVSRPSGSSSSARYIFGGVGSEDGRGVLMFAVVAVFVAGLMVGRTPEYLGKKIEAFEMKNGFAGHPLPGGHGCSIFTAIAVV